MVHDNFDQLCLLLDMIDDVRNDIYIHIDKKSNYDADKIKNSIKLSGLYILPNRIDVKWGHCSQIETEIALLEHAVANEKYEYLHLISGRCLPLVNQNKMHEFFENNKGKEFVAVDNIDISRFSYRYKYYYNYLKFIRKPKKKFWKMCMVISNVFQKCVGINREKNIGKEIKKGANWFSITGSLAEYVIGQKEWIEEHFNSTLCCDEIFLQTIAYNSLYQDKLYQNLSCDSSLRFVDWKRGNPYTFGIEDYDMIMNSQCLFARKFDWNIDRDIIEKIYAEVMGKEYSYQNIDSTTHKML